MCENSGMKVRNLWRFLFQHKSEPNGFWFKQFFICIAVHSIDFHISRFLFFGSFHSQCLPYQGKSIKWSKILIVSFKYKFGRPSFFTNFVIKSIYTHICSSTNISSHHYLRIPNSTLKMVKAGSCSDLKSFWRILMFVANSCLEMKW